MPEPQATCVPAISYTHLFLSIMTIHDHWEFVESNEHHKTLMSVS